MKRLHPEALTALACFAACLFILALAVCRCATTSMSINKPRVCESPCGVTLYGDAGTNCSEYVAAESRAVKALGPIFGDVCRKLRGWRVNPVPTPSALATHWYQGASEPRANAWMQFKVIEVVGTAWKANGLSHEIAHACEPGEGNPRHEGWDERGINAAVMEADR